MTNEAMAKQMSEKDGFIAALDQSGGSTPKALKLYGVPEDAYSNDEEMFAEIHEMRARIIKSPAFSGDKVIGAILFERTMDGEIDGVPTADYLWRKCGIVPFLKIDKGLADEQDGVQLMKPMPDLDALLERARAKNIFGTKERSVINASNEKGIEAIVAQQFEIGKQVLSHGLMPILEPEVNIKIADKAETEDMLLATIRKHLADVPEGEKIMLKLSIPTKANIYKPLIEDPRVMRVVALSGGYSRDEANALLSKNEGMIASFSRALTEGMSKGQSDDEFNAALDSAIDSIYQASRAA
ncbi:MAG: fructose bisphosphate aldolase [Rhizobiales bacterium]|nr:fructose bisphosphate aldolase [Hyphomicrobiales bacterium]MBA69448.1 fructose bisphosphate aldolase [Hyphomicrobiales bacterium]|tara:strand:- start:237 stop:1130 length:894 start_codon:yes stop_codon:yes gene_type:complete